MSILTKGLALKTGEDAEKLSPFECGFRPFESRWQRFSIQFFLVSLVFLVFDVELILMFPLLSTITKTLRIRGVLLFMIFLVILTGGYAVE